MSGGGKGGKTTTEVKIPAWLEEAAMRNIGRAENVAGLGYAPYYGPDVAAMTPFQLASGQGINAAASAFGLPTVDVNMGMPTAQTFDGGLRAYSSGGLYDQAVRELETRRPGQYDAITGLFVDPITGAPPLSFGTPELPVMPAAPVAPVAPVAPTAPGDGDRGRDAGDRPSTSAPSSGGFTSVRDMFDGGGPGRRDTTFSGGPLSGIANAIGINPVGSRDTASTPSKSTTAASTAAAKERDRAAESAANRAAASKSQREAGEGKGGKSGPSSSGGGSSGGSNKGRR